MDMEPLIVGLGFPIFIILVCFVLMIADSIWTKRIHAKYAAMREAHQVDLLSLSAHIGRIPQSQETPEEKEIVSKTPIPTRKIIL